MKTILALMLSTSLFACVAEPTDVELDVADLAENPNVDLDGDTGNHVGPTAGNELPDSPGIAPRKPEGLHVRANPEKGTIDALTPTPEPRDVQPTDATMDVTPQRTPAGPGAHVDTTGEVAELLEAARRVTAIRGTAVQR